MFLNIIVFLFVVFLAGAAMGYSYGDRAAQDDIRNKKTRRPIRKPTRRHHEQHSTF